MKPVKTKSQSHKLALRRETLAVLAPDRLARVAGGLPPVEPGGQEPDWPTEVSYSRCAQN